MLSIETRKSAFGRDVLVTLGANGVISLLGLATGILSARLLGPKGRGELAAIQMWGSFIGIVATLGLPEAVVYFSARKSENAGRYLTSAALLSTFAVIPLTLIACTSMHVLLAAEPSGVVAAARWYLLIIPISALGGLPAYSLRGLRKFRTWNTFRLTNPAGFLLVLGAAYVTGRLDPELIAVGSLILVALNNVALWYFIVKRVKGPFRFAVEDWRPMLRFGLPSALTATPQMLNFKLDQILMAAFLPPTLLGLYVAAVGFSGVVQPLLSAIGAVQFPSVASKPHWDSKIASFTAVTRMSALLVVFVIFFLTPVAPLGVAALFGSKFAPAGRAAMVLVVAAGILGFNSILEEGLKGLGAPTTVMWAEFGGLPVTAVSLVLLLKPLGIMGAALSSLLGYGAVSVLLLVQAKSLTGFSLPSLCVARGSEVGLLLSQVESAARLVRTLFLAPAVAYSGKQARSPYDNDSLTP